ncbi:MAG: D-glycero-beta-D-manno-heptose 1,7-bisphosphate 7-phosphatase [Woeseiaceae bacterium]|nr:D-glycero-beta-D-manno-heptose 1,7-bisphosphate 7-phosphatase [Woeseiaceae bacterium]
MGRGALGSGLIVLDRDGVINRESKAFVKSASEWIPLPGSLDAITDLSRAGYTLAVASNQSGLGRGLFDRRALKAMHAKLRRELGRRGGRIDRIVVCPHLPEDGCDCRKPRPGLLLRLARHYDTSLSGVPFVGDSLRDLETALAAGARPVLVRTGNGRETEESLPRALRGIDVHDDLAAFAEATLGRAS